MSEIKINEAQLGNQSPKELLFKYLPYLPWVILSLAIFVTGAYIQLRYSTPVYHVSGKLLVKDKNPYGKGGDKFSNLLMLPDDNSNLNNEIEIIKSRSMGARVSSSLGLQRQYAMKGSIRTSQAHSSDIPFQWIIENVVDSMLQLSFEISIISNNQFRINPDQTLYNFGQAVKLPSITFRLIPTVSTLAQMSSIQYILNWVPEQKVAIQLSSSLGVVKSEGSSVLNLIYPVENTILGLDIVNQYMKEYQKSSLEDKQLIAFTTAEFINEQLDTLQHELGGVERNLQDFKEKNKIFEPEAQSQVILAELSETNRLITEQSVKTKVLDYLIRYVKDSKNSNGLVPSNLGIEEPSLLQQITEFNALQLRKETLLKTTTENNPIVSNIQAAVEKTRQDILENLLNVRAAYNLKINELTRNSSEANKDIYTIPGKQKQLLEVTRRQTILQELYSFLLQKKLETAISSASTLSDIKVLEPALAGTIPVSPNRKGLYTIAIFLGLAIPIGIIFLLDYLNDKVKSKSDIVKITNAPVLGEIGHSDAESALVVKENNRGYVAEQFRIIRSNLQYVLPKNDKPVILVTSSFSGEGKSFVSTNLGSVLALSGKKTVILEMDIRKPKIMKGLGMEERRGITNFIIGNMPISEILVKVPGVENLFVIPCGPVPPNPAEMLLDEKIGTLFSELRKQFDAIIIDTAPVGLVSDAITLGMHANAVVYIVRHNYTLKKQIQFIDSIYTDKKLPGLSIVINDIKSGGGYGSYYGYGYGYGLGSASTGHGGYFEGEEKKKRKWKFFR